MEATVNEDCSINGDGRLAESGRGSIVGCETKPKMRFVIAQISRDYGILKVIIVMMISLLLWGQTSVTDN